MKTQFRHHIKFGSCWYDSFFKVNTRQPARSVISSGAGKAREGIPRLKSNSTNKNLNLKNHHHEQT